MEIPKLLQELANQLPGELTSDWRGTNHFELAYWVKVPAKRFCWWMIMDEISKAPLDSETELGKHIGLMMDIVAEVSKLRQEIPHE